MKTWDLSKSRGERWSKRLEFLRPCLYGLSYLRQSSSQKQLHRAVFFKSIVAFSNPEIGQTHLNRAVICILNKKAVLLKSTVSVDCSEDFGAKKLFKANACNIHQPPTFCLSSLGILSCIKILTKLVVHRKRLTTKIEQKYTGFACARN